MPAVLRQFYESEDWWAVWIGLAVVLFSVPNYVGTYLLGWLPVAAPWSGSLPSLGAGLTAKVGNPWLGLPLSFLFFAALLALPVKLAAKVKGWRWLAGFAVVFVICWGVWFLANWQPLVKAAGSAEVGFVFALLAGLAIGNGRRVPEWLRQAARGELFIKVAIVLLGAKILLTTFATSALPILTAVFLSFPVVWAVGFLASRRAGLDPELSATLSSGVGVCGISASLATASAIDAPPIYASLMSSIIVVFSAVEILVMPFLASWVFPLNAKAAGAWMGLSVKTDGAASASGSVVDGLLHANGAALAAAVQTKVLIDVWIGLIAFALATAWAYRRGGKPGPTAGRSRLIWDKFPKFVLGYFAASLIVSAIAFGYPTVAAGARAVAPIVSSGTDPVRVMFFAFTFFSIGLATRFSALRQAGLGRPAAVYGLVLAFAIAWGAVVAALVFG